MLMLNDTRRILNDVAGKVKKYYKPIAAAAAAAVASPFVFDKAMSVGREVFSIGRRASSLNDTYNQSQYDSPLAKHRRHILEYAQKKLQKQQQADIENGI